MDTQGNPTWVMVQSSPHTLCTQENAAGHTTPSILDVPRASVSVGLFLSCPQRQEREVSAGLGAHPRSPGAAAQQHNNHGWDTRAQTPHSVDSGGGRSWNPFPWNRNAGAQGTNHPDGTPIFFKNVVKRANADVGRGIPGRSVTPAAP